jgi:acyl carrier protein
MFETAVIGVNRRQGMTLEESLKAYIEENLVRDKKPITLDESLLERGVLDSMGMLNLISFLEEKAGVRVPDDDVLLENFASVNAIVETVDRLRANRAR